jgi:hypothetical protein
MNPFFSFRRVLIALGLAVLTFVSVGAQDATVKPTTKKVGRFEITVRIPEGGLYSEEEQRIGFKVTDTSRVDPVSGPSPVARAVVTAVVGIPSFPSMPKIRETAQPESVPGEYGLHPTFSQGGEYQLVLNVQPPGEPAFSVEFPLVVTDFENRSRKAPGIRPYSVEVMADSGAIVAGQPVTLKFKVFVSREVRGSDGQLTGKRENVPVTEFDVAHEKPMHLIIARKDLGVYAKEHPVLQRDGIFILRNFRFPTSGEYRIFADVAPRGAGNQILGGVINVTGKDKPAQVPLKITNEQRSDGILVNPVGSLSIPAGRTSLVTFELRDQQAGGPVLDLQPYLGAMGHLVMIHQDGTAFVYSHPDERDERSGKTGKVTFPVRPPKPGLYRGWFDFQHSGKLTRVDFVFTVRAAR